jgi:hypothetical protein
VNPESGSDSDYNPDEEHKVQGKARKKPAPVEAREAEEKPPITVTIKLAD